MLLQTNHPCYHHQVSDQALMERLQEEYVSSHLQFHSLLEKEFRIHNMQVVQSTEANRIELKEVL